MKVLVTGVGGQVGQALVRMAPAQFEIIGLKHAQLDLTNNRQIAEQISVHRPALVINAAAYAAVDLSESEPGNAFAVNALGVGELAKNCASIDARLIHLSSDYVFDGGSTAAYEPQAPTSPINAYGVSKLAGENAIKETRGLRWNILRTSWVYAPWGRNFVRTMLRLMCENARVSVVKDQIGAPTSALNLARFLWSLAVRDLPGTFHYADAGEISWYEFAVAISEEALSVGLLLNPVEVKPVTTAEFPTPAKRPAYSLLATRSSLEAVGFTAPHWRAALREVLLELKQHG